MENRLAPFTPHDSLDFVALQVRDANVDVEDLYAEYGFKFGSKQHNFLTQHYEDEERVVVLLHSALPGSPQPQHLANPSVVVRAFGTIRRNARSGGNELELWHISVRKQHPLNDSARGTRWGVFGIDCAAILPRVTWRAAGGGAKLTRRNAAKHIKGTPNPYAMECLVRFAELYRCTIVAQNPEMPCAQLFDAQYCQRTHPATLLLYRALGFAKPPALDHYVWSSESMKPFRDKWEEAKERMASGLPVVA